MVRSSVVSISRVSRSRTSSTNDGIACVATTANKRCTWNTATALTLLNATKGLLHESPLQLSQTLSCQLTNWQFRPTNVGVNWTPDGKRSRRTTKDLAHEICRRSTKHGSDMERSKESRQQPPVMEECRLPMLWEEQEDLSLSHLMTRQGWLKWKAMTKNENLCQYFVKSFSVCKISY